MMPARKRDGNFNDAYLGHICPEAKQAAYAFIELQCEAPELVDVFLRDGAGFLPEALMRRPKLQWLKSWRGTDSLLALIRDLTGSPRESVVVCASDSMALMRLSARTLFDQGRRVVAVLNTEHAVWREHLDEVALDHKGKRTQVIPMSDLAESPTTSVSDVVDRVVGAFAGMRAQGLFISHVTQRAGLKIPVAQIIEQIRGFEPEAFIVVDEIQGFGRSPAKIGQSGCDIEVATVNKAIGGLPSFSFAVCPRVLDSAEWVERVATEMYLDPVYDFMSPTRNRRTSSTTSFIAMVAARAALDAYLRDGAYKRFQRVSTITAEFLRRLPSNWKVRSALDLALRSGIILVQSTEPGIQCCEAGELKQLFARAGINTTAYPGGYLRVTLSHYQTDDGLENFTRNMRNVG